MKWRTISTIAWNWSNCNLKKKERNKRTEKFRAWAVYVKKYSHEKLTRGHVSWKKILVFFRSYNVASTIRGVWWLQIFLLQQSVLSVLISPKINWNRNSYLPVICRQVNNLSVFTVSLILFLFSFSLILLHLHSMTDYFKENWINLTDLLQNSVIKFFCCWNLNEFVTNSEGVIDPLTTVKWWLIWSQWVPYIFRMTVSRLVARKNQITIHQDLPKAHRILNNMHSQKPSLYYLKPFTVILFQMRCTAE